MPDNISNISAHRKQDVLEAIILAVVQVLGPRSCLSRADWP